MSLRFDLNQLNAAYELTTSGLEGIRPVLERTIAQGLGDSDYSAIFEVVSPIP